MAFCQWSSSMWMWHNSKRQLKWDNARDHTRPRQRHQGGTNKKRFDYFGAVSLLQHNNILSWDTQMAHGIDNIGFFIIHPQICQYIFVSNIGTDQIIMISAAYRYWPCSWWHYIIDSFCSRLVILIIIDGRLGGKIILLTKCYGERKTL